MFRFEPPFYGQPLCLSFFWTPCFWQQFLDNIAQMKYRINTKINLCGRNIFLSVEDEKTILHAFIYILLYVSNTFTKSIHYQWKASLTPFFRHPLFLFFTRKSWPPIFVIFQQSQSPINRGGGGGSGFHYTKLVG